jgi:membrane protein YdbS with pleckstrin-like domain
LNFGTLDIQTAGKSGAITFHHLDEPEHCQQIIFGLLEKERSLTKISERAAIREAISQQMQPQGETLTKADSPPELVPSTLSTFGEAVWDLGEDDTPSTEPSQAPDILGTIGERLYAFLPHFREERGETITWHKHPFVLVKAVWLPGLILTGSLLVGIAGAVAQWGLYDSMVLILFIFWCLTFFWLLWRYEDWRNDIFQMTNVHIIDIDRLPLGFRESRRQASLEQIQNINVDIPNLWARVFNYGNVMIETAGATGDLTFEWVMRPRAVQAEIFERVEALRTKKRTEEIEQRRAEMAEWFSVYNQMKDQGEI